MLGVGKKNDILLIFFFKILLNWGFQYNEPSIYEQISPFSWHFLKSRFHSSCILNYRYVVGTLKAGVGEGAAWV